MRAYIWIHSSNFLDFLWFCILSTSLVVVPARGIFEDPSCRLTIVESIPENMFYPDGSLLNPSTYDSWRWLIGNTTSHLNISSFYWSMLNSDVCPGNCPSSKEGETIFNMLILLHLRGRSISIVADANQKRSFKDLNILQRSGAQVYFLNVQRLLHAGIIHTKLITADGKHAYLGSANMDWRSLTQVKELGILLSNCSTLVSDLVKIQTIYQKLSGPNSSIPSSWPSSLDTKFNMTNPLKMTLYGVPSLVYFAASPPQFMTASRTDGIDSILNVISNAKKFVYVAVMDYFPLIVNYNGKRSTFWPLIDDAFRRASIDRQLEIRLLASYWLHTRSDMLNYLKSLSAIRNRDVVIKVKMFEVPGYQNSTLPYSRVNHNKYMVTDNSAFIGTSNWSGDYFVHTCGISLVIEEKVNSTNSIRGQLQAVFERDWNSEFSRPLWI